MSIDFDAHPNADNFRSHGHGRQTRYYWHNKRMRIACYLDGRLQCQFERLNDERVEVFISPDRPLNNRTRKAINFFMSEFGIKARVSFVGGKITVRMTDKGMRRRENENQLGVVMFTIYRNNFAVA